MATFMITAMKDVYHIQQLHIYLPVLICCCININTVTLIPVKNFKIIFAKSVFPSLAPLHFMSVQVAKRLRSCNPQHYLLQCGVMCAVWISLSVKCVIFHYVATARIHEWCTATVVSLPVALHTAVCHGHQLF
jgi:hypothetical protein